MPDYQYNETQVVAQPAPAQNAADTAQQQPAPAQAAPSAAQLQQAMDQGKEAYRQELQTEINYGGFSI